MSSSCVGTESHSAICTLYEGSYEQGVAVLVNSLAAVGFRGTVWAGHRDELPSWAKAASRSDFGHCLEVSSGLKLHFVRVETDFHLTNYKPRFLRKVWEEFAAEADALFYFDPDIVVRARWSFFEEWASYGVALVEDVNSPMPESHPRRGAWKRALARRGRRTSREMRSYANGGFIGVRKENAAFLTEWELAMEMVGEEIGGLSQSMFGFQTGQVDRYSPEYPYNKTDQDALNIAMMTSPEPLSVMGREAMDFAQGGWTMAHAIGAYKPWSKPYLLASLQGRPPSAADREYWRLADGPINFCSPQDLRWKRFALKLATGIGRFYRRPEGTV